MSDNCPNSDMTHAEDAEVGHQLRHVFTHIATDYAVRYPGHFHIDAPDEKEDEYLPWLMRGMLLGLSTAVVAARFPGLEPEENTHAVYTMTEINLAHAEAALQVDDALGDTPEAQQMREAAAASDVRGFLERASVAMDEAEPEVRAQALESTESLFREPRGTTDHREARKRMIISAGYLGEQGDASTASPEVVRQVATLMAAAQLLEAHDDTGISLDDWQGPRFLVEVALRMVGMAPGDFQPNGV